MLQTPTTLPFLKGPNAFTVGLRPIETGAWLLPDDQIDWIGPKNALMDANPGFIFAALPSSLRGQTEAADLIETELGKPRRAGEPPLFAASRLVSDDLCLMEHVNAAWTLTALSLSAPTFFTAREVVGGSLAHIHGPVPDKLGPGGTQALADRIGRIFTNMAADVVMERHNWTVQWGNDRHTPDWRPIMAKADTASLDDAAASLHLRVERQTIRRLPKSGGVLFTIRIRHKPLSPLLEDRSVREQFEMAWRDTPPEVRAYKHWEHLERHVRHVLAATE
jgi:dimethylamine monooxygenase subunit A